MRDHGDVLDPQIILISMHFVDGWNLLQFLTRTDAGLPDNASAGAQVCANCVNLRASNGGFREREQF